MIVSAAIPLQSEGFGDIHDITDRVRDIVEGSKIGNGLVTVFCPGSTGAIATIEFEEGVLEDLKKDGTLKKTGRGLVNSSVHADTPKRRIKNDR